MAKKRLSIVIVTYNSAKEIGDCLKALEGFDSETVEIIVVDNASQDTTVEFLRQHYAHNPQYRLVFNDINSGFSGGANQCVALANSEVILSINPDTTVSVSSVMSMLDYFEHHPEIGIIGPKITDEYGVPQESYGKDLTPWNELMGKIFQSKYMEIIPWVKKWKREKLDTEKITEVGWIGGACFMMRKEVYQKTGGINQQFFLSHADLIDLSKKVKNLGLKNVLYAPVSVIHTGGKSSVGDKEGALRTSYIGTLFYFETYYGPWTIFFAKGVYVTTSLIKSIIAFPISLFQKNPYRDIANAHFKNAIRILTGTLGRIQ